MNGWYSTWFVRIGVSDASTASRSCAGEKADPDPADVAPIL